MLSNEHLKLLLQAIAVVLALHFAKGSMTGEYRNLMAVGLVAVVLVVVNRLFSEYEGMTGGVSKKCEKEGLDTAENCLKDDLLGEVKKCMKHDSLKEKEECMEKSALKVFNECKDKTLGAVVSCEAAEKAAEVAAAAAKGGFGKFW